MLEFVLNFLFPPSCIICGKLSRYYICKNCEKRFYKYKRFNIIDNQKAIADKLNIKNIEIRQKFYLIGNQKIYWEKLIYCFDYRNIVRKYILKYKFNNKAYISNFFAYQILNNKKIYEILKFYDIILPVPMSKEKCKKRGYNQAKLITNVIAKNTKIQELDIIEKVKETKTQSLLNNKDRKINVKDAFCIKDKNIVKNKNVILFDDIYTTGATVNEISKLLKNAGVRKILVLVIAKD
jgi:competence protein ComFC